MGPFVRVLMGILLLAGCRDTDRDGTRDGRDCLPENPDAFRGGVEVCDGIDNDCDGQVDEDVAIVAYWDRDRDGFGDPEFVRRVCSLPADGSLVAGDCDDQDTLTNPDAIEICDLLDNDCDGDIDEDVLRVFYADEDGDGHGDPDQIVEACFAGPGRALTPDDCDDSDPAAWTDRAEICDNLDNDCDGDIDEDTEDRRLWADADGDGYGDPDTVVLACGPGPGVVDNDWDCDDDDPNHSPDTMETRGNGDDDDCDGYRDELGVGDAASNEFTTLDDALAVVEAGDVIQFDGGTHFVNVDLRSQNGVDTEFTLAGEGCGRTTLVGLAGGSVLRMDKGRLERLTVSGGTGTFIPATELTLGGGLAVSGDVTVAQACFEQNSAADHGGGIAVGNDAELRISDSVIADNASGSLGGGIWVDTDATLHAVRVEVISNNASVGSGGGIGVSGGEAYVTNAVVADNRCFSERGCGIQVEDGTASSDEGYAELRQITFHGNRSNQESPNNPRGTALGVRSSEVSLSRSLITGHLDGPPIWVYQASGNNIVPCPGCELTVTNTGFQGNRFPDLKPHANPASWVVGRLSGSPAYVDVDPETPARDWDFRLRGTSDFLTVGGSGLEIGAYGALPGAVPEGPFEDAAAARDVDTDGDGLLDGWEWHTGTNPWVDDAAADPDADGQDNTAEQAADTDPHVADTDGDGVDDGEEAGEATDPLDPRTHRPTAHAGPDGVAWVGEPVDTTAAGSFDPNDDPLTYQWTLIAVPGISVATLTVDTGPAARFTPDEPGSYELEVEVSDGTVTHTDRVVVRAFEGIRVPDDVPTLAQAVAAVDLNDAIGLRAGTYDGGIALDGTALTVVGLGAPDEVVVRGNAQGPVISVANAPVTLVNLTLTGGHGDPYGGGLAVDAGDRVELHGIRVVDNTADLDGAGIWLRETPGAISDALFARNVAGRSGGAAWIRGSTVDDHMFAERLTMVQNAAPEGAGIHFVTRTAGNIDANLRIDGFVCQDQAGDAGACLCHHGADNTAVFAANGVMVGHDAAASLVHTLRGRTIFRSTAYADNPGSPGAAWIYDGLPSAASEHFAGLDDASAGRERFADSLGDIVDTPGFRIGTPVLALATVGGDGTTDLPHPTNSDAVDRGFLGDLDPDGSTADIGACGGPHADPGCTRFGSDLDADGLDDGWEQLLGPIDAVAPGADPDADGLDNAAEHAAGTDPRVADTDLDGVSDADELGATDPTDAGDHRPVAVVSASADPATGFVQLDGAASHDPNDDPLTFQWTVLDVPEGSIVTTGSLSDPSSASPSFFADVLGYYRVELIVSDGTASSRPVAPAVVRGQVLEVVTSPTGPSQFATLQEAVDVFSFGDVISIGAGTFPTTVDLADRAVSIRGQGADLTVLEGDGLGSILATVGGAVELTDLTLRGGTAEEGAGVSCQEGALTMTRVTLQDGLATLGGGVALDDCDTQITDSAFVRNYVGGRAPTANGLGGAIRAIGGSLDVLRTRFDRNAGASNGGTVDLRGTLTTIRNSVFTRNGSLGVAAAVHIGNINDRPDAAVTIDHCTFVGNASSQGGVVQLANAVDTLTTITNSLFVESEQVGVSVSSAVPYDVRYNGYFDNGTDTDPATLAIAVGSFNVRLQDPRFVAWDPFLPELDDLRLLPWSPMIDRASDTDLGGGVGDIGAYGGVDASPDGDVYLRDTDGDGMTDVWESANGFDPDTPDGSGDADADGLSNAEEHDAQTDPRSDDTDGDGVLDGSDTQPTVPASRPTAQVDNAVITRDLGLTAVAQGEGSDPDGDTLTAEWTLLAVPGRSAITEADLSYSAAANPTALTFTPDRPGTYRLQITYTDGTVTSEPAFLSVRIRGDVLVPEDYATVAAAIDGVVEGSTVQIAAGTWPLSYDSGEVGVRLTGAGAGVTVLDAQGEGPVLTTVGINAFRPVVTLTDLTVTGGLGLVGGGLSLVQATLTLEGVEVTGNDASEAGGVSCANCSVSVMNSAITDNYALHDGGGMVAYTEPAQSVVRRVDVSRTLFAGNDAILGAGGAVFVEGELEGSFTNVVFADNLATQGGAVSINARSSTGGAYTFDHVTATFNEAVDEGAFLHLQGRSASATVDNTIVWEHAGADAVTEGSNPTSYAQSYSLFADNEGNYDLPTLGAPVDKVDGNIIDRLSPDFVDVTEGGWASADWSLQSTSGAVDEGTGASDADGSDPDIGAFGGPEGDWVP